MKWGNLGFFGMRGGGLFDDVKKGKEFPEGSLGWALQQADAFRFENLGNMCSLIEGDRKEEFVDMVTKGLWQAELVRMRRSLEKE